MKKNYLNPLKLYIHTGLMLCLFTCFNSIASAQSSMEYTEADVATFVTDLEAGTYFVQLLNAGNEVETYKVVVR